MSMGTSTKMTQEQVMMDLKTRMAQSSFPGEVCVRDITRMRERSQTYRAANLLLYFYRGKSFILVKYEQTSRPDQLFDFKRFKNFPVKPPSGTLLCIDLEDDSSLNIRLDKNETLRSLYADIRTKMDLALGKNVHLSHKFNRFASSSTSLRSGSGVNENAPTATPSNENGAASRLPSTDDQEMAGHLNEPQTSSEKENKENQFTGSPLCPKSSTPNDQSLRSKTTNAGIASEQFYGFCDNGSKFGPTTPLSGSALFGKTDTITRRRLPTKRLLNDHERSNPTRFPLNDRNVTQRKKRRIDSKEDVGWKSSTPTKINNDLLGFSNLGNTCYMNSILQALLGIEAFAKEIHKSSEKLFEALSQRSLFRALSDLLRHKDAVNSYDKRHCLQAVKRAISSSAHRFSGYQQQDAHEFLSQVLEQLSDEFSAVLRKSNLDGVNPVTNNFGFVVCHQIQCQNCENVVTKEEEFIDLALDLPIRRSDEDDLFNLKPASLQEMLDGFFATESVEYKCEKCDAKNSEIRHTFLKNPRVLILYVKRYSFNAILERGAKVADEVAIPRFLSLQTHCNEQTEQHQPVTESTKTIDLSSVSQESVGSPSPARRKLFSGENEPAVETIVVEPTTPEEEQEQIKKAIEKSLLEPEANERDEIEKAIRLSMQPQPTADDDDVVPDSQPDSEVDVWMDADSVLSPDLTKSSSILSVKCDAEMVETFDYRQVDLAWQTSRAELLRLEVQDYFEASDGVARSVRFSAVPKRRQSIERDGNCLFRAIAFLLTGSEECHGQVRSKVCDFMVDHRDHFKKKERGGLQFEERIERMALDGEWGTTSELMALATMLQTDIYTYIRAENGKMKWKRYNPQMQTEQLPNDNYTILLANEAMHYEPVLTVADEVTDDYEDGLLDAEYAKMSSAFRLAAVVSHKGHGANSGHYVCDVWEPTTDSWRTCDDSHVSDTTFMRVRRDRSKDSYIFFFVARELSSP